MLISRIPHFEGASSKVMTGAGCMLPSSLRSQRRGGLSSLCHMSWRLSPALTFSQSSTSPSSITWSSSPSTMDSSSDWLAYRIVWFTFYRYPRNLSFNLVSQTLFHCWMGPNNRSRCCNMYTTKYSKSPHQITPHTPGFFVSFTLSALLCSIMYHVLCSIMYHVLCRIMQDRRVTDQFSQKT